MSNKAGFVSFVGRPNVGKSTLTNALVGEKVAITSEKPQTTRRAIRGIANRPEGQLIIVDTPGLHKPRTLLGERLNDLVESTLGDMDIIGFCTPADQKLGPGDLQIIDRLSKYPKAKKFGIVTKVDLASPMRITEHLLELSAAFEWDEIIPVSASADSQLDVLATQLMSYLPDSPNLYPLDQLTEESPEQIICELVRESALSDLEQELPHSLAVTFDEVVEGESKPTYHISVHVERDSQKGIIIGKGGAQLAKIRNIATRKIEKYLGFRVVLAIHVKVSKDWQRDPKQLGRLGF